MTARDAGDLVGYDVHGAAQTRIGSVAAVYRDGRTGRGEWMVLDVAGTRLRRFVPLAEAVVGPDLLRVPYDISLVITAPDIDTNAGHLSDVQEGELYAHYGLPVGDPAADPASAPFGVPAGPSEPDLPGPTSP